MDITTISTMYLHVNNAPILCARFRSMEIYSPSVLHYNNVSIRSFVNRIIIILHIFIITLVEKCISYSIDFFSEKYARIISELKISNFSYRNRIRHELISSSKINLYLKILLSYLITGIFSDVENCLTSIK